MMSSVVSQALSQIVIPELFHPRFLILVIIVLVAFVLITAPARRGRSAQRMCRNCGAAHPYFARFCRRCGQRL